MTPPEARPITLVTWNAQGRARPDIAAAAAALAALAPDVLLLQEIQRRQLGALAAALAPAADRRWRFKHWPLPAPAEGLGVISRLPIVDTRAQVLAEGWRPWDWRRRIAVHVAVDLGPRVSRLVDVHLGAGVTNEERQRQIAALLADAPRTDVVAGDLNAFPSSAELAAFAAAGFVDAERRAHPGSAPPATNWEPGPRTEAPTQRLDYVLVRDTAVIESARVPTDWESWARLSDHLPVVARLTF